MTYRHALLDSIMKFGWSRGNDTECGARVPIAEIELALESNPIIISDRVHSESEKRLIAIGTAKDRAVFVVFTLRDVEREQCIRPISARYMHKKEVESHGRKTKTTPWLQVR